MPTDRGEPASARRITRDGFQNDLQIDLPRNHARFDDGAANRGVPPVIVATRLDLVIHRETQSHGGFFSKLIGETSRRSP